MPLPLHKAAEIPLIQISGERSSWKGPDQEARAQVYHNSELQMYFSRRIPRYLRIFCAKWPAFGKDTIYWRLCSERVQSNRCSL